MGRNDWTDEKLFFRLLNNKSDRTYWENISALRKRPTHEVFDKCIELTFSKDPKAREIGIDTLAQLGTPLRPFYSDTIKRFFELLETENDPEILKSLLIAISHNNEQLNQAQINKLCEFANTDNDGIKEGLVFSLLRIKNPFAIDTLIKLSSDRLDYVRDWATFGIGSMIEKNNRKIRAALWARVNDKHEDTKYEAIVGLAIRKDARVKGIIKRELLSRIYSTSLFEAIIDFGDKDFLPLLRQHFKEDNASKDINPEWLKELKECISELGRKLKHQAKDG